MSPFYRTVAACLRGLLAYWAGNQDLDAARRAFDRAAALARADENELGELYALGYLARLAVLEGDGERAERLLRRAESLLATGTGSDVHFVAMAVHLARALESERRSDAATARKRAWQALHLARGGAGRVELLGTLAVVARAEANVGETVAARRLLREAEALEERCVDPGRGAAELDAVRRRLSAHTPAVPVQRGAPLSERELSILRLLPGRPSVRDLAAALYLSPNTVKTHLRTIYRKLGAETRDDAVLRGREAGLL
jgi:LuxR family maltose regulon positive regulatory protein